MAFEVGKTYTFTENEFEKSRESGKLVFKVSDPASATPYTVKPFEFQITDIPDKIVCIYKGNDRFEQDQNSVVPDLYEVGKEYRFRVMRQDNNAAGHVSIRDDARGLTFFPIDLGKARFQRFQRITCEVLSIQNGHLKLRYVNDVVAPKTKFSVTDLKNLKGAHLLLKPELLKRMMSNPLFDDSRLRFKDEDPVWILTAMEAITNTNNIPLWFARGDFFYKNILDHIRELSVSLIERSEYLNNAPFEERRELQQRLSEVILNCEDYLQAAELITKGIDVEYITETLASLRSTGWLYKPERKMRLMMALFTLKNSYAHDYIWEIFKIIRDHHADVRFLEEFSDGFILMLQIFIDNEGKFVNISSPDALRELIEAIAILLLLTQNKEYARWNYYRGRMYTLAMLLIGRNETALVQKAFGALTDNLNMPLEYSWKDLDDVNRLCHVYLCSLVNLYDGNVRQRSVITYEGQNATLTVRDNNLRISPAATGTNTKEVLSLPLSADLQFAVSLNGRLTDKVDPDDMNIPRHHKMWRELESILFDPNQKVTATTATKIMEKKKLSPEVGDEVSFRVVGREEGDQFTFHCVIEDPVYEGEGVINTRDIVLYPITAYPETFMSEGQYLLFSGRIIATLPDGRFRFSIDKEVDELIMSMAQDDCNEEVQMDAVVTKDLGESCLAVTEWGYPVMIYKKGEDLHQSQRLVVTVTEVGWNKKSNKPYVAARFEDYSADSSLADNYRMVRNSFHDLLTRVNSGRIWVPEPKTQLEEQQVEEEVNAVPDAYLPAEAVYGLSRLFNAMANVNNDNITEVYSLLATARLLALLTGDNYRAQYVELKQSLVETLSRFMIDDRVDADEVMELSRKVEKFPGNDSELNSRLGILKILATLDLPGTDRELALPDEADSPLFSSLKRMVTSYNLLRGLKLNSLRQELKRSIYDLLNLQMPNIDVSRVNAVEDQQHEFKESLIYPAGNKMKADEKKQGLEIAQVICGMLNTRGGTLYIGVANTGVPRGLESDFVYINNGFEEYDLEDVKDKFSLRFCKVLRTYLGLTVDGIQLYPSLVTLEFDDIDGHCFAVVSVKPYRGAVKMLDGSMFIRQESSTLPVKKRSDQEALDKNRRINHKYSLLTR
jgi:hypothetical protein